MFVRNAAGGGLDMAGAMDGVRGYLRTVRSETKVTQRELAKAVGLSLRALQDWEGGETDDLKGSLLVRAIAYLRVPYEHVQRLVTDQASAEEGQRLAEAWVRDVRETLAEQPQEYVEDLSLRVLDERLRRLEERADQ